MKQTPKQPTQNGKIRFVNYPALFGTLALMVACIALLFLTGIMGWEGFLFEIGQLVLGLLIVMFVFDLGFIFRAGITVREGILVLGKSREGIEETVAVEDVVSVRLITPPPEEKEVSADKRIHARVNIEFLTKSNRRRIYEAHMLTSGQYRRLLSHISFRKE